MINKNLLRIAGERFFRGQMLVTQPKKHWWKTTTAQQQQQQQQQQQWKKRSERLKHCVLAVVRDRQKFRLPTDPLPGGAGRPNLNTWRWSLPLPTDPVWWRSMHAISSYHGNRLTPTSTNPQTGPITIHWAAKLSAQCNKKQTRIIYASAHIFGVCCGDPKLQPSATAW